MLSGASSWRIQLAMLSGAGDENLRLTRFLDHGHCQVRHQWRLVRDHEERAWVTLRLRARGTRRRLCSHVSLRAIHVGRHALVIGGQAEIYVATPEFYARLHTWVRLATMTVRAETPGFVYLGRFTVLRLQRRNDSKEPFVAAHGPRASLGTLCPGSPSGTG